MDEREDASGSGESQDILCKTAPSRSKVPFPQLSEPASPGGALMTASLAPSLRLVLHTGCL